MQRTHRLKKELSVNAASIALQEDPHLTIPLGQGRRKLDRDNEGAPRSPRGQGASRSTGAESQGASASSVCCAHMLVSGRIMETL